jgi:hypothetical protein
VRLTDLSYEDWLEHAFGHEARIGRLPGISILTAIAQSFEGPGGQTYGLENGRSTAHIRMDGSNPSPRPKRF